MLVRCEFEPGRRHALAPAHSWKGRWDHKVQYCTVDDKYMRMEGVHNRVAREWECQHTKKNFHNLQTGQSQPQKVKKIL
jgi:hypothetical protein